jgi:hypothetical protein
MLRENRSRTWENPQSPRENGVDTAKRKVGVSKLGLIKTNDMPAEDDCEALSKARDLALKLNKLDMYVLKCELKIIYITRRRIEIYLKGINSKKGGFL